MKTKYYMIGALASLALSLHAPARTWTSADGSKTFEGDFQAFNAESNEVTVKRDLKKTTFALDMLSDADREWVKAEAAKLADSQSAAKDDDAMVVTKKLTSSVLSRLDGKRFKKAELSDKAEYFLLYFTASW